MQLPYTSSQDENAELFCFFTFETAGMSEVKGISSGKSLEVRFFCPGKPYCKFRFC